MKIQSHSKGAQFLGPTTGDSKTTGDQTKEQFHEFRNWHANFD